MNAPAPGRLAAIHLCRGPRVPMGAPESVEAKPDHGLVGDRHARKGSPRQVLLADTAVIAAEGLVPGDIRENLAVEGIAVDGLVPGTRLRVGESAVLRVTGPCEPCDFLEKVRPGLRDRLVGRRGSLAVVEAGGKMSVGDAVVVVS